MKRIELYKTVEEAEAAFKKFCDVDHDYDCNDCPYWNKFSSCELRWAMEEVDDTNIKTGKWVDKEYLGEDNSGTVYEYYCSVCGARIVNGDFYSYCPECGTKMEEIK